jgi:hypothetical protein
MEKLGGCLNSLKIEAVHAHRNGFIYARKPQMMTEAWKRRDN